MIKDLLVSFKDNMKIRSSNPFLGTYALVWCIRNWKLVYSLFFFDSKTTLTKRLDILASYYNDRSFVSDLFWNILWAIGVLILTFLLINLSRLIVNLFEKRLTPYIYKITDSDSIVLKDTYDRLKLEKQELEIKLERERDSKSKMQKEISSLEGQIEEMFRAKVEREGEESLVNSTTTELKNSTDPINILFNKLKSKNLLDNFLNTVIAIKSNEGWMKDEDENMSYYVKIGLIDIEKTENEWTMYHLTENGAKALDKARLEVE